MTIQELKAEIKKRLHQYLKNNSDASIEDNAVLLDWYSEKDFRNFTVERHAFSILLTGADNDDFAEIKIDRDLAEELSKSNLLYSPETSNFDVNIVTYFVDFDLENL